MEKIKNFKKILIKEKIDGYLIPKNDEFFGEYTPDHNDRLKFITSFSGSYGFSLILKDKNYLFVDGRYTLQAKKQCGKHFKIFTFPEKMPKTVLKNKKLIIGFDPKLFTKRTLDLFFKNKNCRYIPIEKNLIDIIWKRKIRSEKNKFYNLPEKSVGSCYKRKIEKIITNLKKKKGDFQFITASENSAWLLNIRGRDTEYTPIPYCYILVDKFKNVKLFCNLKKITKSLKKKLAGVQIEEINKVNIFLSRIIKKKFLIDENSCSIYLENIIKKNNKILNFHDPIYLLKSIKSLREIKNTKKAHVLDGAAVTKYLFWLKKNFNKKNINEITASNKLLKFRKKNKSFKFSSFPTISGSGPNGAIIHYKATKKTNRKIKKGDIYLVDSGGQYEFGTTDVTRTISLKNSNKRIKNIFTRVLKGHIAVADFKLKKNSFGAQIDYQARKYLKQIGLDYAHGTGHGVGYFLNVHEGPHAISKNNKVKIKEGMIVSNEPGYYEKNNFGIRIENLMYVKKYGSKNSFENLTMAPIDKDLIEEKMLNLDEKRWLNEYHKQVFNNLKGLMNRLEFLDLKKACSAI